MLAAGLFKRFPKPDFALAVHNSATAAAGTVEYVPGFALASVDSVDVTLYGKGGHGAYPHTTVDPVLLAARYGAVAADDREPRAQPAGARGGDGRLASTAAPSTTSSRTR